MKGRLQIRLVACGSLAVLFSHAVAHAQSGQPSAHPIAITDADTNQPVGCYVNGLPPDGKARNLGKTHPPGQFTFKENCVQGYGLQFVPEDGSIYYEKLVYCDEAIANGVKLKRIPMPQSETLRPAFTKEVRSDPASEAFVSHLLAFEAPSELEANSYKLSTFTNWARYLRVEKPIVYQGINLISPSEALVLATKEFQSKKGLEPTGAIDYKTLKSAARPDLESIFKGFKKE
jgi:hypothetical protein